jgi:hypothetical protein
MDEIIRAIAQKLNLPEATVASAITVILNFIKQEATGTQYEKFIALIPGASAQAAAPLPTGGGGLFGGLMGAAGSLLGGQAGVIAKAASGLQSAGIEPEQIAPFLQSFFHEAKGATSEAHVETLLTHLPVLQDLVKGGSAPA